MVNLTRDDVLKLALLAQLELDDDDLDSFRSEISEILGYVDQLSAVEIGDREPTNQVTGLKNVMRTDELIDYGMTTEDLLKNVPETKDNMIKVKRMIG